MTASHEHDQLVTSRVGQILGRRHRGVHVFKGVPYTAAPVGPLRFRPPEAMKPWAAPLDASAFGRSPM